MKMGMADAIVDLVSSGTTLRENNLKEIEGGVALESQVTLSHTHMRAHFREKYFIHFIKYPMLCRLLLLHVGDLCTNVKVCWRLPMSCLKD